MIARRKRVALTFDDGPADSTLDILAVLEEKQVPATFFVVGRRVQGRPDILARLAQSAYAEIGNHSATHADLITLTADEVREQLQSTNTLVNKITGQALTAFRPPRGHHNEVVRQVAGECGLSVILFSLNPKDWADQNPRAASDTIISQARDGDIVVLHDTLFSTAQAIGPIIDGLRARGFTLVPHRDLVGALAPGEWSDGASSASVRTRRWLRRAPVRLSRRGRRLGHDLAARWRPSTAD
ncbi:MAG: polysaccharide deacetylase family protein [Dermatophilaceae bacterium]